MAFLKPDSTYQFTVAGKTYTVNKRIIPDSARRKVSNPIVGLLVKPGKKFDTGKPLGLTIHNTADINEATGTTDAEQYSRAMWPNCSLGTVCVHFFVWHDAIWQNLDLGERGWHAADGSSRRKGHRGTQIGGNLDTISIECISADAESEATTAALAAYLCDKFSLDPQLDIYTHNFWMGLPDSIKQGAAKNCPLYILPHWGTFLATVQAECDATTAKEEAAEPIDFLSAMVPLAQADAAEHNLLASLTLAQAILESANGTSELAVQANNLFGIKATKDWTGDTYDKKTKEWQDGEYFEIVATFRAYPTMAACVADRAAKITGMARYQNLVGVTDIKTACDLIEADGWATSPTYSDSLLGVVEAYNLTKYDVPQAAPAPSVEAVAPAGSVYAVQTGAFKVQANAAAYRLALAKKGVTSFVSKAGSYYKVQTGAFRYKANADAYAAKLAAKGVATVTVLKEV